MLERRWETGILRRFIDYNTLFKYSIGRASLFDFCVGCANEKEYDSITQLTYKKMRGLALVV